MLPWKLRKRQFLSVNQNLLSVHFSLAKFQLVSSNLSLAMIWQVTYNQKLPKLCSATLRTDGMKAMSHGFSGDTKTKKKCKFYSTVNEESFSLKTIMAIHDHG